MQAVLSGEKVIVASSEANILGKGYGRKKGWLELSLEEAAFLLETGKIEIKEEKEKELNLEDFLKHALDVSPKFGLLYKDLKERGFAVRPGGVDFWLYPRGAKPGEKQQDISSVFCQRGIFIVERIGCATYSGL